MARKWEYTVQFRMSDLRHYRNPDKTVHGISWSLMRGFVLNNGSTLFESVVVSPEVFENEEDAKRDALEKLSILRCPIEKPIDHTIRWMLNG